MNLIKENNTVLGILESTNFRNLYSSLVENGSNVLKAFGLPYKTEEYKYTPLTKKIEQYLSSLTPSSKGGLDMNLVNQHIFEGFDGDLIVINNGFFEPSLSSIQQNDLEVFSILDQEFPLVGNVAKTTQDPYVALNNCLFQDGVYIKVGKKKWIEKPVLILKFNDQSIAQSIHTRVFVEVEDQSSLEILEYSVSLSDKNYFTTDVTEIKVGANSQVQHNRLQNESDHLIGFNHLETDIHKDAVFTSVVISLKADMLRNNLHLNLQDSGTTGNMYGLYLLNGKSHVDNHTQVDHLKPHCQSNELYKGILDDSSRGVFNGKIFVRQDAQKTNAFQQNNNVLLSEDAIINTKPQLEIWADDVKCSHGCTTGQLDEEALFYLQARGIGKESARALLLHGVAGEVVEFIKNEAFKEYCTSLIHKRLEGHN
jgi:Fe-S cluster assembly protein SufD